MSRNLFYRNLRDPYSREWQPIVLKGWMVSISILYTYLIDPSILNFSSKIKNTGELLFSENGRPIPSFKLEELLGKWNYT